MSTMGSSRRRIMNRNKGIKTAEEVVGMRLFCLPWEGANTQVFEQLSHLIPAVQMVALQYPGRLNRVRSIRLMFVTSFRLG